jgi:hypothetical protein
MQKITVFILVQISEVGGLVTIPQEEDLTKIGYRSERKVELFWNPGYVFCNMLESVD